MTPTARSTRARLILSIVATDMTFELHESAGCEPLWVGKCIHCNRRLGVGSMGATDATVEHIVPRCAGGEASDPRNLALACASCNNEKGVRHDRHAGRGGRSDLVIAGLAGRRAARWRDPVSLAQPVPRGRRGA